MIEAKNNFETAFFRIKRVFFLETIWGEYISCLFKEKKKQHIENIKIFTGFIRKH